ncbi:LamG-like jellyroll fold domain-containing protein [Portibacter lacus]|uniref:LamG-like jellyroll fold domain-containing protein n=1 Tax=Portibacter lacus TaxID=1099794 RepID=A0AA37SM86_9BACT|nr:LamG-like jellyroll fold domain-containing protein [Portibacter lacus]GLR15919.1 hypothetical protein GCM10007940_05340 [Portibacter lacus]
MLYTTQPFPKKVPLFLLAILLSICTFQQADAQLTTWEAGPASDWYATYNWGGPTDASCDCMGGAEDKISVYTSNISTPEYSLSRPHANGSYSGTASFEIGPGATISRQAQLRLTNSSNNDPIFGSCVNPCGYTHSGSQISYTTDALRPPGNVMGVYNSDGSYTVSWTIDTDMPELEYSLLIDFNGVEEQIFGRSVTSFTFDCVSEDDEISLRTYGQSTTLGSSLVSLVVPAKPSTNTSISGTVVTESCNGDPGVIVKATLVNPEDLSNSSCWPLEYIDTVRGSSGSFSITDIYRGVGNELAEYEVEAFFPATQTAPARSFRIRTTGAGCPYNPTDSVRTVVLGNSNPNPMGESFIDITSFVISGTVTSEISGCGLEDVDIMEAPGGQSGITPVKTNADGSFEIVVSEPNKDYEIWARYRNESIADSILTVSVELEDVTGVSFIHTGTDTLKGFVGAGCFEYLGEPTITISTPDSSCVIANITTNSSGYYEAILPARPHIIEVTSIDLTPGNGITDEGAVLSSFGGSLESDFDSTTVQDFIYRKPLTMEVNGFPALSCAAIPYPIVKQGSNYFISILVKEGGNCPVDTGKVIIYDNIGVKGVAGQIVDSVAISQGVAIYQLKPGDPNFFGDQTKSITFQAKAGDEMAEITSKAVVTGSVQSGNNFTTAAPTELPFLILRDPPGDMSYSEFMEENVTTIAQTFSTQLGGGVKVWANAKVGVDIFGLEIWGQIGGSFEVNSSESTTEEFVLELTNSQTFKTSDNENIVGEKGDVFVGAAVNFIYARARVLEFDLNECSLKLDTLLMLNADGFETTFIYTEGWIKNQVIPTRQELADNPTLADSIRYRARNDVKLWEQVLQLNEELKREALLDPINISLDAGSTYSETKTISKSNTKTIEFTTQIDIGIAAEVGFEYNNNGVTAGVDVNFQTVLGEIQSQANTNTTSTTYHLEDSEKLDNSFTINVAEDPVFGTPVFQTLGGQTSCPYEENTERLDDLTIVVQQPIQNVSSGNEAFFFFDIISSSYDPDPRNYRLALNSSSAGGVDVTYGGDGFATPILVPGVAPGLNSISTPIKVTKPNGLMQYDFEGIQFFLYPDCEDTESYTQADLAVPFSITAYFDSPCSNVDLLAPNNNWEISGADNNEIEVTMAGYDLSSDFDQIIMQYRKDGGNWQPSNVVRTKAQLSVGSTPVFWDVTGLEDGEYSIRFRLNCGNIFSFSNRVNGLIDRNAPIVYGIERPTNDRYVSGGEISVDFNEIIDCEALASGTVYMKTLPENEFVPVSAICDSNKVVIQLMNEIGHLYNQAYEVGIVGITDLFNNERPATVKWEFVVSEPDSDGDGNPDTKDICPGGDDFIDRDMDGLPDDCDCLANDPGNGRSLTKAALDFDGVNDYIKIPHNPAFIPTATNAVTIETWIYPKATANEHGIISQSGNWPNRNHQILLNHASKMIHVTGIGVNTLTSNSEIPYNKWSHIAVVFNLNETKLYINGKLDNTRVQTLSTEDLGYDITIGNQESGGPGIWNWQGKMDEMRYWDHALTQGDIQQNMNKELGGFESGLLAYYDFNEGSPFADNSDLSEIIDKSENGFNGTMTNFAKSNITSNWVKTPTQKLNVAYKLCDSPCPDTTRVALDFTLNGSNAPNISVPNVLGNIPTSTQSVTFEAWIKPKPITMSETTTIIQSTYYGVSGFPINNYFVSYSFDGHIILYIASESFMSNEVITFDKWTHIAIVMDKTHISLYINGQLDQTTACTFPEGNLIAPTTSLSRANASLRFRGAMDDVRFWDGVRTPQQIEDNYESEIVGDEANLVAYYNFNDGVPGGNNGSITEIRDISGNGLHGVMGNFKKSGDDSNWVPSLIGLKDSDKDGTPDFCDDCSAKKSLVLKNMNFIGNQTFRAEDRIILGENIGLPANANIKFRAPEVRILNPNVTQSGMVITVQKDPCDIIVEE